jgi:hypothetical protein
MLLSAIRYCNFAGIRATLGPDLILFAASGRLSALNVTDPNRPSECEWSRLSSD